MVIKKAPGILTSDFSSAKVVFNTKTRLPYILNSTASEIWDLCEERTRSDEIIARITRKYGMNAEGAAADVKKFIKELEERGLLVRDGLKSKAKA